jgi:hypothetical protein
MPNVLRPEIFFPASYPLVSPVTVAAPRTERASTIITVVAACTSDNAGGITIVWVARRTCGHGSV